MKSLLNDGASLFIPNTNPTAKLDWRWEIIDLVRHWLACLHHDKSYWEEGILNGMITELGLRTHEVKYGTNSELIFYWKI